jgi:ABC-type transport system substrate-binding protein
MRITVDKPHGSRRVTRRDMIRLAVFSASGLLLLPACSTAAPAPAPAAKAAAPAAPAPTSPAPAGSPGAPAAAASSGNPAAQAAQQAPAVTSSGTVRIAVPRSINALDSRTHRTTEEQNIFHHLYDSLMDLDPKLNLRPRLAESWEAVDPTTWRFKLRQGV